MNAHTPGPWTTGKHRGAPESFGRFDLVTSEHGLVADVCGANTDKTISRETAAANAALIAAAPEMLAALQACVTVYENHRDEQPTGHLWPDPNHIGDARRAISKATGKNPSHGNRS